MPPVAISPSTSQEPSHCPGTGKLPTAAGRVTGPVYQENRGFLDNRRDRRANLARMFVMRCGLLAIIAGGCTLQFDRSLIGHRSCVEGCWDGSQCLAGTEPDAC